MSKDGGWRFVLAKEFCGDVWLIFCVLGQLHQICQKNGDKSKFTIKLKEVKRKNPKADAVHEDKILVIGNYKIFSVKPGKELKVSPINLQKNRSNFFLVGSGSSYFGSARYIVQCFLCWSKKKLDSSFFYLIFFFQLVLKFKNTTMVFSTGKNEICSVINELRKCWVSNFPNISADKCFQLSLPPGTS